jgi:hypothetical protein
MQAAREIREFLILFFVRALGMLLAEVYALKFSHE